MNKTNRRLGFVTFFSILTMILLCIALFFALTTGFGNGVPGMGVSGLSRVCKRMCAGIPFKLWPQITLLIILVLLFLFLAAAGRWIDRASRKKRAALFIALSIFLIFFQLLIVFRLNIIQNTDSFEVQDQALAIARKMFYAVDYTRSAYFRKYGNNDLYLMTCIGIYRLCDFLSIQNWPKVFALINMLCVDLGILFTCDIVRCMTDRRTALKAYMLCALNPLNVLLLQWTYTCTFSVPLMLAGIWLAVRMYYRRPSLPVCAIGCAAIGCITAIGYYMRPTAVFPVIALILAVVFHKIHQWNEKRRAFKTYQKVLLLLLTVIVMAGSASSIRHLNSRYDPDNLTKFPLQHWIMIGIRGTGRVTGEDIQYTEKYETKEEKTAADQAAIKEALRERGAGGTFLHYVKKLGLTWSDGTSEYYQRTTESENSGEILYQLVNGKYCGGVLLYCQAYRIILLLLAIIGIMRAMRSRRADLFFTTFVFTILGGLLFYIVWEGKPVYSYPFTFCLIIPAIYGWKPVQNGCMDRLSLPRRQENALIQLIMTCILLVAVASTFGRGLYVANDDAFSMPSIICDSKALAQWNTLAVGDHMTQEFYPAYRFNHLRIAADKVEMGSGAYRVTIESQGKTLVSLRVTRSDIYNGYLTLYFSDIIPQKGQKFTLTISNENSLNNTIEWGSRLCYITSEYKGARTLNGKEQPGDILIRVYYFNGKS